MLCVTRAIAVHSSCLCLTSDACVMEYGKSSCGWLLLRAKSGSVCTLRALEGTFIRLLSVAGAIQDNGSVGAWEDSEGPTVSTHTYWSTEIL